MPLSWPPSNPGDNIIFSWHGPGSYLAWLLTAHATSLSSIRYAKCRKGNPETRARGYAAVPVRCPLERFEEYPYEAIEHRPSTERVLVYCVTQLVFGIVLLAKRQSLWPGNSSRLTDLDQRKSVHGAPDSPKHFPSLLSSTRRGHDGAMRHLASVIHFLFSNARLAQTHTRFSVCRFPVRWTSHASHPRYRERLEQVPVGSSGSISLRVIEPPNVPAGQKSKVLLYLPPGLLFTHSDDVSRAISTAGQQPSIDSAQLLASTSLCTTVTVNYRLGSQIDENGKQTSFKFPIPVHDTLAGFDWILRNLDPSSINVFGKHIGGSLALMLALTEPRLIAGVAAQDPICDWVGLDDYCIIESGERDVLQREKDFGAFGAGDHYASDHKKRGRRKRPPKPVPTDLVSLLIARNSLFHAPQNYFDSFASPTLFLRSSGKYCPTRFPAVFTGPNYPIPVVQPPEESDMWVLTASILEDMEATRNVSESAKHFIRRRKTLARWPPVGSDYGAFSNTGYKNGASNTVVLPNVRIFVHSNLTPAEAHPHADSADTLHSKLEKMALDSDSSAASENSEVPSTTNHQSRQSSPRGSLPDVKKIGEETVLAAQGAEMVELMRSACFWGREKGFGESRVKLIRVPYDHASTRAGIKEGEEDSSSMALPECGVSARNELGRTEQRPSIPIEEQAGEWFRDLGGTYPAWVGGYGEYTLSKVDSG
ncbi:predicted protein [Uncinocarpus reesii 1704]|uniref:Uncharacterized protein n=1 Tax=Uncinocarpus reesii (strain UAMH 1704) TaxID=336963 RepID=C4JG21_UNCRE|nr:uncharacterized protein UREG_01101 [Uncinocarpus reesii 1704]EEP76252.1 predicted protein [Uncinocarpus reesii 1704]